MAINILEKIFASLDHVDTLMQKWIYIYVYKIFEWEGLVEVYNL